MRLPSADDVYVRAPQRRIAQMLTRLSDDVSWWPGARAEGDYGWVELDLRASPVARVRFRATIGPLRKWEGFSWTLEDGELVGRAEWWLEAQGDGTIVHYLLDVERGRAPFWRSDATLARRHRWAIRRGLNALKDRLETSLKE